MGRGRAKAKQTKVARALKYHSPDTDLAALQRELGRARGPGDAMDPDDTDQYDGYADEVDDGDDADDADDEDNTDDEDHTDDGRWATRHAPQ